MEKVILDGAIFALRPSLSRPIISVIVYLSPGFAFMLSIELLSSTGSDKTSIVLVAVAPW